MRDDVTLRLLSQLERSPNVRAAFAAALRLDLHRELGFARAAAEPMTPGRSLPGARRPWQRLTAPFRPMTLRGVALALLSLLLVACSALAVYEVARTWLGTGDRGPQHTSDFWLTRVYTEPDAYYDDVQLAPDGQSLIAFRQPFPKPWGSPNMDPREWAIVRIPLGGEAHAATTVTTLEDLRHAVRWDPGVASDVGFVQRSPSRIAGDLLSVASNGDLFVALSLTPTENGAISSSSALVVIHPDRTAQTIVTAGELEASGLLAPLTDPRSAEVAGVASAPNRLWVRASAEAQRDDGTWEAGSWLLEIVDPTADGDWSDRVVHPLVLPASTPRMRYATYDWQYAAFVAEPSTPGNDRSHSILLPMISRDNEYRLYRLTDPDGDGTVTGDGSQLLLSKVGRYGLQLFQPSLDAGATAGADGQVAAELVLGGLSRETRVSRLTPTGLEDILRGLPTEVASVHAASDGSIYVTSQAEATSVSGWAWVVYRLIPAEPGATPPPGAIFSEPPSTGAPASAQPSEARPPWTTAPLTAGVSQLRIQLPEGSQRGTFLVGADGSGPAELVAGYHPIDPCLSTDGTKVAFQSEREVPNEPFIYVADLASGRVTKMSEDFNGFECPFTGDTIVLSSQQQRYVRHDLATGKETELLRNNTGFISPDARTLVAEQTECFGTACFNTRLILIDVATGAQRVLERHVEGEVFGSTWSPDGRRIAYPVVHRLAEPPDINDDVTEVATDIDLYVADVGTGLSRRVTTIHGLAPDFSWSADGSVLTALVPSVTYRTNGTYTIVSVNVVTGKVSSLPDTGAKWAAWSPTDPTAFAYVTMDGLFIVDDGTTRRLVAKTPTAGETGDEAVRPFVIGWSPDGKLFGRVEHGAISVIDVATGRETPIWADPPGVASSYPWWWR